MSFLRMKGPHLLHIIMLAAGRMIMVERWLNLDTQSQAPLASASCEDYAVDEISVMKE
jgi:hypothetical protein